MFIIVSGCSGVGKNTVIRELLKRNSKLQMFKTCTTRERRESELVSSDYIHLTKAEFEEKLKNNELFEHEEIHGNYYGTLNSSVELMKDKNNIIIKDIGVEGQKSFVDKLPKDIKVISIFLDAPKAELINRLIGRGEPNIEKRIQRYEYENSFKQNFDYVIDNVDLLSTVEQIEKIIETHLK